MVEYLIGLFNYMVAIIGICICTITFFVLIWYCIKAAEKIIEWVDK